MRTACEPGVIFCAGPDAAMALAFDMPHRRCPREDELPADISEDEDPPENAPHDEQNDAAAEVHPD